MQVPLRGDILPGQRVVVARRIFEVRLRRRLCRTLTRAAIWRGVCSCASKSVCRMSLTTNNCKSERDCKIPLNLYTSVNQTAVIEGLQETKKYYLK